jgi:hypothetical protein
MEARHTLINFLIEDNAGAHRAPVPFTVEGGVNIDQERSRMTSFLTLHNKDYQPYKIRYAESLKSAPSFVKLLQLLHPL